MGIGKEIVFLVFFVFVKFPNILSLDVHWIPSDPHGPLPLSSKYRQELEKLCQLIHHKKSLPKEIQNKKETIINLCQKLKESNSSLGEDSYSSSPLLIYLVIAGAILYLLYSNQEKLMKLFTKTNTLSSKTAFGSSQDSSLAREARLKKFDRND